jgi:hypothetical protein
MQYRVLWAPNAEEKLERLLKISPEPALLAAATREIDQYLIAAPAEFGESRSEAIRVGFVFPLGVQFEVMDDVRTVIVHDVWRIDQRT